MIVKTPFAVLAAVVTIAGSAAAQAPHAAPQNAPTGDGARGRQLYMSVGCYQCHGTIGQGGGVFGPRLAPGPIGYQYFVNQIRTPRQQMPFYTAVVLPDNDVADIYTYLRSIPPAKKLADIPLLAAR